MAAYTSTILVTGGTLGLGYWATYELAVKFPESKIIIASRTNKDDAPRNIGKMLQQKRGITASPGFPQVEFMPLDLASTKKIREFVKTYASKGYPPISSLLLNAGLQFHSGKDIRLSPDGIETTFAVNHLGHALLLFLLKPYLANECRIVITASGVHDPAQKTMVPDAVYESAELLAHPTDSDGYEVKQKGLQRYSSSKLANVLFEYALERRLKAGRDSGKTNWTVVAMDPGLMPDTGLGRDLGPVIYWIARNILARMLWFVRLFIPNVHTSAESGRNLAALGQAKGPQATSTSGKYYEGDRQIDSSVDSYVEAKQEDLWRWTVDFLAQDEQEKKAFETF